MVHFTERMEGTVSVAGATRAFSFDVEANGEDSVLALAGRVRIEGLCPDVPVDARVSRLEVGVPFRPFIRYTLGWTDLEGNRWRFFGEKQIRLLRVVTTMTTLRGNVYRNGEEVGPALLRFPLRTLPSFLASWVRRSPTARAATIEACDRSLVTPS